MRKEFDEREAVGKNEKENYIQIAEKESVGNGMCRVDIVMSPESFEFVGRVADKMNIFINECLLKLFEKREADGEDYSGKEASDEDTE
jgi:hypothetical protein